MKSYKRVWRTRCVAVVAAAACVFIVPAAARAQLVVDTIASFGGVNGRAPSGALVQGPDGALYGTTNTGGADGGGTVFRLDPTTGSLTVLHSFSLDMFMTPPGGGAYIPLPGLLHAVDGKLYGITNFGGTFGHGTMFRILSAGSFELLHSFSRFVDGRQPAGTLIQDASGMIYGVTNEGGFGGGVFGGGTLFAFNPATSSVSLVASLSGASANPIGGLTNGRDGFLYGTGFEGIFKATGAGVVTTLRPFAPYPPGVEGVGSWSAMTFASDTRLFGTTYYAGAGDTGTLFRIKRDGSDFVVLHHFAPYTAGFALEGARPVGALTEARDGHFYGTTSEGGLYGGGTLFRLAADGTFTHLYDFPTPGTAPPAPLPFGYPTAVQIASPLLLGADGALYGTTMNGGDHGKGSVFRITGYAINRPPDCSVAAASVAMTAPSGRFMPVTISGITDPDGDGIAITATSVAQDEPVGFTTPDATLSPLTVRAERDPRADGRVYHINVTAIDTNGASCAKIVKVCIPRDQRPGGHCVDGGPLFPSTP